jgi:hypothetical protein
MSEQNCALVGLQAKTPYPGLLIGPLWCFVWSSNPFGIEAYYSEVMYLDLREHL